MKKVLLEVSGENLPLVPSDLNRRGFVHGLIFQKQGVKVVITDFSPEQKRFIERLVEFIQNLNEGSSVNMQLWDKNQQMAQHLKIHHRLSQGSYLLPIHLGDNSNQTMFCRILWMGIFSVCHCQKDRLQLFSN